MPANVGNKMAAVETIEGMTIKAQRSICNARVVKCTVIESDGEDRQLTESVRLYWPDEIIQYLNFADRKSLIQ